MKCQILFSGKNKKNISKCRLLKILPRVLSVKSPWTQYTLLLVPRTHTHMKTIEMVCCHRYIHHVMNLIITYKTYIPCEYEHSQAQLVKNIISN